MELGKREIVWKHDARRAECFHTISSFPNSTSVDITIYQYGKNVLYIFYNIAMSKARRIRKFSVFTSGGKFPVLTLSYINTALSQSAFRIYKCYIININTAFQLSACGARQMTKEWGELNANCYLEALLVHSTRRFGLPMVSFRN